MHRPPTSTSGDSGRGQTDDQAACKVPVWCAPWGAPNRPDRPLDRAKPSVPTARPGARALTSDTFADVTLAGRLLT